MACVQDRPWVPGCGEAMGDEGNAGVSRCHQGSPQDGQHRGWRCKSSIVISIFVFSFASVVAVVVGLVVVVAAAEAAAVVFVA